MKIQKNVKLAPFTTYRIGGPAKYFIVVKTEEDIREALSWARSNNVPYFILGGGSNLLVADEGYNGLVISLQNNNFIFKDDRLIADAGTTIHDLVTNSVEREFSGLEWAGGLPGQLGGAIRGNANCFGGHMHDVIKKVRIMLPDGSIKIFSKRQCKFSQKNSIFKQKSEYIILSAELKFKKGNKNKLQERVNYCVNWRAKNQPKKHGTCGSVFTRVLLKDLPKDFFDKHPDTKEAVKGIGKQKFQELGTGYLIDRGLGLKGMRIGGAMVSYKHANFVVNVKNAKAEHILIMNSLIKSRVMNKYGIILEEEVHYLN